MRWHWCVYMARLCSVLGAMQYSGVKRGVWCVVCGLVLRVTVQGASNDDCTATTTTSCLLLSLTTNQVY